MILRDLDLLAKRFLPSGRLLVGRDSKLEGGGRSAAVGRNPKKDSPCPPCLSDFNTERTEHLRELCVETFFDYRGHRGAADTAEIFVPH